MIQSVLLKGPQQPEDRWWRRPEALRALAYAFLARVDPELACLTHTPAGIRPFTGAARQTREELTVRLTGLNERISQALIIGAICLRRAPPLMFGDSRL